MGEKIREIGERYKNPDYVPDLMTTDEVESDIKYLLSHIKELEEQLKHSRISNEDLTKLFEGGEDG